MRTLKLTLFALFLMLCGNAFGQGWIVDLNDSFPGHDLSFTNPIVENIERTTDNNYVIQGRFEDYFLVSNRQWFLIKVNQQGVELWRRVYGEIEGGSGSYGCMMTAGRDNSVFFQYLYQPTSGTHNIVKVDETGDSVWHYKDTFNAFCYHPVIPLSDGGIISIALSGSSPGGPPSTSRDTILHFSLIDSSGKLKYYFKRIVSDDFWPGPTTSVPTDSLSRFYIHPYLPSVLSGPNNSFYGVSDFFGQFDSLGNPILIDSTRYSWLGSAENYMLEKLRDGNALAYKVGPSGSQDTLLIKYDTETGDTLWTSKEFPTSYLTYADVMHQYVGFREQPRLLEAPNGDLIHIALRNNSIGPTSAFLYFYNDIQFIRLNSDGELLVNSSNTIFQGAYTPTLDFEVTSDGGAIIPAIYSPVPNNNNFWDIVLIKLDKNGFVYPNKLSGNIYAEINPNCQLDSSDYSPSRVIIEASKQGQSFFTQTDGKGNYTIELDTGSYSVNLNYPSPYYQNGNCSIIPFLVNSDTLYQTDTVDIPFEVGGLCPYMTVDLSAPFVRRCAYIDYNIQYCNLGTAVADSAYIELSLPKYAYIYQSELGFTALRGSKYKIDLGNVAINYCDDFRIGIHIDSSCTQTILGQSMCIEARIYPDTICFPTPTWDGSDLVCEGECKVDSGTVELRVINNGGPTSVPSTITIIEDNVMLTSFTKTFNVGEVFIDKRPDNGRTYTISATQSSSHPWKEFSLASVEACGDDGSGNVSLGYVVQFPQEPEEPFISRDCQEIIGSYDPNDKAPFPKGIGADGFITKEQDLQYRIRFQNTGTDTAFRVVIRDTLSQYLDMATVVSGASSHPYQFQMFGRNVLQWTFDPIALPDSGANQAGSNGFVKFSVSQVDSNALGTVIENRAGIYFDFNPPIITNTTRNVIGELNDGLIIISVEEAYREELLVYPNPFANETTLQLEQVYDQLELRIYDLAGQLVETTEATNTDRLTITSDAVKQGMYLFEVYHHAEKLGGGKLMKY